MKINDVKALDYRTDGDLLTIPFADTSVEAVLALDAAVLTVKTDAGDTVEVLAGYALKTATVAAADPDAEDGIAILREGVISREKLKDALRNAARR